MLLPAGCVSCDQSACWQPAACNTECVRVSLFLCCCVLEASILAGEQPTESEEMKSTATLALLWISLSICCGQSGQ